jgi:hypothetical protein
MMNGSCYKNGLNKVKGEARGSIASKFRPSAFPFILDNSRIGAYALGFQVSFNFGSINEFVSQKHSVGGECLEIEDHVMSM